MELLKKYKIETVVIFAAIISIFLAVYSVFNYKSSNSYGQDGNFPQNFSSDKNSNSGNNQGMQNGNIPSKHGTDSQGNTSSGSNTFQDNRPQGNMGQGGNMQQGNMGPNNNFAGRSFSAEASIYSTYLCIYGVVFIGLSILVYYLIKNKKVKIEVENKKVIILALFVIGLFFRIAFAVNFEGYTTDLSLFRNWASSAANSIVEFYSNSRSADYPPFFIYVLGLVGKIANIGFMSSYYTLLLKIPSIIADLVTAYMIYRIADKKFSTGISIFLSMFYIFNPAVFIDSALWGQVDSFFTMILAAAIWMIVENKIYLSTIFFAAAVLMKPQGIIFTPVLFFELVRLKNMKKFIIAAVTGLAAVVVILIPFSINQESLWIIKLYQSTISEYPYASVNAFNFFSLIQGNYVKDSNILFLFSYKVWGLIFIVINTIFSWFIYIKGKNNKFAFLSALILITGTFTFSTGMHERYLFPATVLALLTFICIKDKIFFIIAIGLSITNYFNIAAILFDNSNSFKMDITAVLNIVLVIFVWITSYKNVINKSDSKMV